MSISDRESKTSYELHAYLTKRVSKFAVTFSTWQEDAWELSVIIKASKGLRRNYI